MDSKPKYQRKLSQRLSERQYEALRKHIPNQLRQRIIDKLLDGLIDLYESPQGEFVNSAILSGHLTVTDLLDRNKEKKHD